jgi:peptide deformylase
MSQLAIFYPLVTVATNETSLRKKSERIKCFDEDIQDFSMILLSLMYEYDGIGLAAPQLGQNIRMIAVTQWKEQKAKS